MKRVHFLLTGLSVSIFLLSVNRLTSFTLGYLQPFEFLRWVDFNAMLPIPLITVILYFLLLREVTLNSKFLQTSLHVFLMALFITGVYLFGASSGSHEVTNYLNTRFCDEGKTHSEICNIISYNDDEFSHIIYYLGFVVMSIVILVSEDKSPRKNGMTNSDKALVAANGLFIGLGIFANLAFEEIGIDLYFFGLVMLLSFYLLYKNFKNYSRFPVIYYSSIAYGLGVLATVAAKLAK